MASDVSQKRGLVYAELNGPVAAKKGKTLPGGVGRLAASFFGEHWQDLQQFQIGTQCVVLSVWLLHDALLFSIWCLSLCPAARQAAGDARAQGDRRE